MNLDRCAKQQFTCCLYAACWHTFCHIPTGFPNEGLFDSWVNLIASPPISLPVCFSCASALAVCLLHIVFTPLAWLPSLLLCPGFSLGSNATSVTGNVLHPRPPSTQGLQTAAELLTTSSRLHYSSSEQPAIIVQHSLPLPLRQGYRKSSWLNHARPYAACKQHTDIQKDTTTACCTTQPTAGSNE